MSVIFYKYLDKGNTLKQLDAHPLHTLLKGGEAEQKKNLTRTIQASKSFMAKLYQDEVYEARKSQKNLKFFQGFFNVLVTLIIGAGVLYGWYALAMSNRTAGMSVFYLIPAAILLLLGTIIYFVTRKKELKSINEFLNDSPAGNRGFQEILRLGD